MVPRNVVLALGLSGCSFSFAIPCSVDSECGVGGMCIESECLIAEDQAPPLVHLTEQPIVVGAGPTVTSPALAAWGGGLAVAWTGGEAELAYTVLDPTDLAAPVETQTAGQPPDGDLSPPTMAAAGASLGITWRSSLDGGSIRLSVADAGSPGTPITLGAGVGADAEPEIARFGLSWLISWHEQQADLHECYWEWYRRDIESVPTRFAGSDASDTTHPAPAFAADAGVAMVAANEVSADGTTGLRLFQWVQETLPGFGVNFTGSTLHDVGRSDQRLPALVGVGERFFLAWRSSYGGFGGVSLAEVAADGSMVGTPRAVAASRGAPSGPTVAVGETAIAVLWMESENGTHRVHGSVFDLGDGSVVADQSLVGEFIGGAAHKPAGAWLEGRLFVAWAEPVSGGRQVVLGELALDN